MKKRKSKSWAMAYCGMAAALCVALMLLGTIIPIAMFIAPAVASFLIATVCMECGITMAWTAYAAVSLLGVIVPAGSVSQELRTTALAMTLLTLAMGNVAFALYDRALCNMLLLYKLKWQPKLHKMLGMH